MNWLIPFFIAVICGLFAGCVYQHRQIVALNKELEIEQSYTQLQVAKAKDANNAAIVLMDRYNALMEKHAELQAYLLASGSAVLWQAGQRN